MTEMEGQLPLFTLDGADQEIQDEFADEECDCVLCISPDEYHFSPDVGADS